jgi:hypothetical protein
MASKPELISRVNWDTVACKSEGLAVDRHAASLPRYQMASPRWRPKFQSTTTPRRDRARDMLAEFLFERRPPRHQLKLQPIVNHGEAARRQRQVLPISAGDVFPSAEGRCTRLVSVATLATASSSSHSGGSRPGFKQV